MNAKVIVTHNIPGDGLAHIRTLCDVVTPPQGVRMFTPEQLAQLLPDADAILACGPITAEMMASAPKLKIISNYGAGYDRIDVNAASARGIPVTNIPDDTADATAELALSLMLSVCRRIAELDRVLRTGDSKRYFTMGTEMGHTLKGKTLGILGMGHIGGRLAQMVDALGMNVVYHNRRQLADAPARYMELDELLRTCDVLSVNCPLTDSTRGMISAEKLALMKPSAYIVNTSRGGTLDYAALAAALKSGKLAGAGLDVFPQEPHVPEELLTLENVVLTPHIGTNTVETRADMAAACAMRILDALNGKRPANVVNPEIYG